MLQRRNDPSTVSASPPACEARHTSLRLPLRLPLCAQPPLTAAFSSPRLICSAGAWGPRRAWPSRRRRGCCARPAGRREAHAGALAHDALAGPRARPSVRARRPPPRPPPSPPPVPRSPTRRARGGQLAVSSATRARWAAAQVARGRRHRLFRATSVLLPAFGGGSADIFTISIRHLL